MACCVANTLPLGLKFALRLDSDVFFLSIMKNCWSLSPLTGVYGCGYHGDGVCNGGQAVTGTVGACVVLLFCCYFLCWWWQHTIAPVSGGMWHDSKNVLKKVRWAIGGTHVSSRGFTMLVCCAMAHQKLSRDHLYAHQKVHTKAHTRCIPHTHITFWIVSIKILILSAFGH